MEGGLFSTSNCTTSTVTSNIVSFRSDSIQIRIPSGETNLRIRELYQGAERKLINAVSESNINRQIIALHSTVGQDKVSVIAARMRDINPDVIIHEHKMFYLPENADSIDLSQFDYIVDAVDTVAAKLELIKRAKAQSIPVISSMGTGNKLDPTAFCVTDISKTNTCPLARVMRRELKKRGITHARVIYSTEEAITPKEALEDRSRRSVPGSLSFVPSVAGLIAASEAVKSILKGEKKNG